VAEPKLSRFEFTEALARAMDAQNEVAKRLDETASPRELLQELFADVGLDVDVSQLGRDVEPRGRYEASAMASRALGNALTSGEPLDLGAAMTIAWVAGCLEGVALGLHIGKVTGGER
jgi:hypothetical protein